MKRLAALLLTLFAFVGAASANVRSAHDPKARHVAHKVIRLAQPVITPPIFIPPSGSGDFTLALPTGDVLHFISPTGNDSNNGTSTSTPWKTTNHALNCGDVILAEQGDYSTTATSPGFIFGTTSNCPSTTGGIDGTGGLTAAVLLCAGSDLGSSGCSITCTNSGCSPASPSGLSVIFDVASSHWAIEGWTINGTSNTTPTWGYLTDACASGTTQIHHIMFINDIVYNSAVGYGTAECALNHNVPGNGTDYWAVVGSIAENAAQGNPGGAICAAGISATAPSAIDANAGTHILLYGNFSYATKGPDCGSDQEGFILDTWDAHGYTPIGAVVNNMYWYNCRWGLHTFYGVNNTSDLQHQNLENNTGFADVACAFPIGSAGEISIQAANGTSMPNVMTVINNITVGNWAFPGGGATDVNGDIYALNVGGPYTNETIGGTGNQNIFRGIAGECAAICDPGDNANSYGTLGNLGTNTYTNPNFTSTSDLLTNWISAPNCTGFETVTACMGYNARTLTLTPLTPIADLTPTAAGMAGKGYQLPSTTCSSSAANGMFPSWLKGLVYQHASGWTNGATITVKAGLVTKPCNM